MSSLRFFALLWAVSLASPGGAFADDAAGASTPPAGELAEAEEDVDAGWRRPMFERVKVSQVARPLTTSRRIFDVWVTAGGFSVTQVYDGLAPATEDVIALDAAVGLRAGAHFGLTDDSEISAEVLALTFTNGVLISPPSLSFVQRVVRGSFELGLSLGGVLPIGTFWTIEGRVPMQWRFAELARLELVPTAGFLSGSGGGNFLARLPVGLLVQVAPPVYLAVRSGAQLVSSDRLSLPIGGEIGVTISGERGALVEIAVSGEYRKALTRLGTKRDPNTDQWLVLLGAHFFVPAGPDPSKDGL